MDKIFLLIILPLSLAFTPSEGADTEIQLNEKELNFIADKFNWTSEEIMIINFRQPRKNCHYDNYNSLKKSIAWWTEFYSEMELENVHNIFVYAEGVKAKRILDNETHFVDPNFFFLKNFFNEDRTCYGVLVINKNGEGRKIAGEYSQKDIIGLIHEIL